MNTLQTVLYTVIFTFFQVFLFAAYGTESHLPSYLAGIAFAAGYYTLDRIYGRKRELRRRQEIAEEYERMFGSRLSETIILSEDPEPKERGPE